MTNEIKIASEYGFKAFPDRELAVELAANGDDYASQEVLDSMANTDFDYGFTFKNRSALKKLNKMGLSDAIKKSPGYIEEAAGYTKIPDIYTTPDGAATASAFIRNKILPEYKNLDRHIDGAIQKEIKYVAKINAEQESYNEKKLKAQQKIIDAALNYQTSRDSGILDNVRGTAGLLSGKVNEIKLVLDTSRHRKAIDHYKEKISDVPKDVMYSQFAKAIDNSLGDNNELYDFRYY